MSPTVLANKLVGGQVAQRAVGAVLVVIYSPSVELLLRVGEGYKLVHVQALIPYATVKRLDVAVVRGFTRSREVELYPTVKGPGLQRSRDELCPMIDGDRGRIAELLGDALQGRHDMSSGERHPRL